MRVWISNRRFHLAIEVCGSVRNCIVLWFSIMPRCNIKWIPQIGRSSLRSHRPPPTEPSSQLPLDAPGSSVDIPVATDFIPPQCITRQRIPGIGRKALRTRRQPSRPLTQQRWALLLDSPGPSAYGPKQQKTKKATKFGSSNK